MTIEERQQLDLIAIRLETEGLIYPDCKWLINRLEGTAARIGILEDMLLLILPMAKGYAAEHPVGNNQQKVNMASMILAPQEEEA